MYWVWGKCLRCFLLLVLGYGGFSSCGVPLGTPSYGGVCDGLYSICWGGGGGGGGVLFFKNLRSFWYRDFFFVFLIFGGRPLFFLGGGGGRLLCLVAGLVCFAFQVLQRCNQVMCCTWARWSAFISPSSLTLVAPPPSSEEDATACLRSPFLLLFYTHTHTHTRFHTRLHH